MIETNLNIMKYLVNICVNEDVEALREYEESIGKRSKKNVNNSKGIAKWDIIYNNFINDSESIGFRAIPIHRGRIWTAIGVYVEDTKELFLVFRKPNFEKIMKYPWQGHYAPIANIVNGSIAPRQPELFLDFEIEKDIIIQYDKLSEELFEKMEVIPQKVILCSFTSDEFKVHLYNRQQQLVDDKDLSHLIEPKYSDLSQEQENVIPPHKEAKGTVVKQRPSKKRIIGLRNK